MAPLNNSTIAASDLQDVSIKHSVQKWLKNGCPPKKMILGIPFVVATFTLEDPANNGVYAPVSGSGNPCPVTNTDGNCAYFELCRKFNETEWTIKWDEDGACPYAFRGDQWVSYENAASVEQKAAFASTKGLGGVFSWEIGYDDYRVLYLVLFMAIGALCTENTVERRVDCIFSSSTQTRAGVYAFEVEDIPIEYCTHVIYDHISFDGSTLDIMPNNPEYDVVQNGWDKFIDLKKTNPKLKLLMSVKSVLTSNLIQPAEQRKSFIDAIVGFVEAYKFDGVSIPWYGYWHGEGEEKGTLYKFFEELRRSFEAVGHPEWEANIMMRIQQKNIDYERICRVADSVSLISVFDSSKSRTNLLSPLNNGTFEASDTRDVSITHSVQKWLNNDCPPNKIILGVPFLGRTFTLEDPGNNGLDAPVSKYGTPCPVTKSDGACGYFELCQKFNETEWTFKWDEEGAAPYAFQGDQWITFENPASVEKKAAFARTRGLGGVFSWELGYDDYRGSCAVLITVFLLTIGSCFAEQTSQGHVHCTFTSYSAKRPGEYAFRVDDIPTEYCTHVIYDTVSIERSSLTFLPSNPDYDVLEQGWEKFFDLKKTNPKVKLLMAIHSAYTSSLVRTPSHRAAYIDGIVSFLSEHKFDGVSIGWFGYWEAADVNDDGIYTFFEELRGRFVAVGHPEWEAHLMIGINEKDIDHSRICQVVDIVSLVGILEHRTKLNHTNVIAPLSNHSIDTRDLNDVSIKHSLQTWLDDGCPANKMVLGVPFVVQTFTLADPKHNELGAPVSGPGKPCPVTDEQGVCSYMELCQEFNRSEWTFKWDEEGEVPYAFQEDQWVTYETVLSVHRKVSFAKSQGLGGVSGMNLSYDDYRGKCGERYPLTKAVWNASRT
ncbi:hypothetical protein ZHAS_00008288 [Anopheles sinensis]|uniref:chitinase n=1 Tax=Anopheles sinensis TaxID=74873 RepID=A0A084VRS7_ANOSI|nr:hypothetical protein ZHAS_00008288 [Anopheles sinensis]